MSARYHATSMPTADGGTDVIVIDTHGDRSHVEHFTREDGDRFYQALSDLFDAGVARYGTVDAFVTAMRWYTDLRAAERAA